MKQPEINPIEFDVFVIFDLIFALGNVLDVYFLSTFGPSYVGFKDSNGYSMQYIINLAACVVLLLI